MVGHLPYRRAQCRGARRPTQCAPCRPVTPRPSTDEPPTRLVAGDVIRTLAALPRLTSTAIHALIVVIRTFLSFPPKLEITGLWPRHEHKSERPTRRGDEVGPGRPGPYGSSNILVAQDPTEGLNFWKSRPLAARPIGASFRCPSVVKGSGSALWSVRRRLSPSRSFVWWGAPP
ncbi:DUF1622 domain-containing protein [Lapillicoccus sp.]|uniref:DUF1622 domain-containing protein n=1 Tax=Lapillicoccus sp. TaxID=1909287 RepID=UPI003983BFB4